MSSNYTREKVEACLVNIDLANKAISEIILAIGNIESESVREVMRRSRLEKIDEVHGLALDWARLTERLEKEVAEEAKADEQRSVWNTAANNLIGALVQKLNSAGVASELVERAGECLKIAPPLTAAKP